MQSNSLVYDRYVDELQNKQLRAIPQTIALAPAKDSLGPVVVVKRAVIERAALGESQI